MKLLLRTNDQQGYTLLETVVAMALFVGVLIPVGAAIGNLTLDNGAQKLRCALHLGEAEVSAFEPARAQNGTYESRQEEFLVKKTVSMSGSLVDLSVSIAAIQTPNKRLLMLHKTFLVYR
jgi:type II secretory pathway pseudopilin PulG